MITSGMSQISNSEEQIVQTVKSFYTAFNSHDFSRVTEFTTEDWNHISPGGRWTRGRKNVLDELQQVHSTFLKGVTDTIEDISVQFATDDVALVTVTSRVSTYMTPDGIRHENEHHRRTFIVVQRSGRWLLMLDQNTIIQGTWV